MADTTAPSSGRPGSSGGGAGSGGKAPPPVGSLVAALSSMPPPPPRAPKRKEVVLDEDDWTSTLEAIIERDFFPELSKLESKVAWLQAVRSGDPEQIRHAQLLIAQRRAAMAGGRPAIGATPANAPLFTPGGTAARAMAGDTPYIPHLPPGTAPRGGGGGAAAGPAAAAVGSIAVAPPGVSLDAFLAAHTSEDNASFQEILEDVNKRRRLKAARSLVPEPDPKAVALITEGREKTDGFGTTGQAPGTLIPWRHNPKNALYYDSSTRDVVPYSEAELAAMVQGPPKAINHGGTRFPHHLAPSTSGSATPSASTTSGGGGGGGQGPAVPARVAAVAGGTRGFDILATPSFEPGAGDTPFMTWGDIEATPMRIEAEDLPPGPATEGGPLFYIREGSRKEQAGLQLASKAGASLRRKGLGLRGGTPIVTSAIAAAAAAGRRPGSSAAAASARPGSARPPTGQRPLSEAARRLASSLHKQRGGAAAAADDLGLRASYRGPTPGSTRGRAATPSGFGSSWSANPTPSRRSVPAPSPAVAATLEAEEARVQALLRTRQREEEAKCQLEQARQLAKRALAERAAAAAGGDQQQQPQQQQPARPPDGGGAADLTAGLLDI